MGYFAVIDTETHNALFDAMDELKIMGLLGREIWEYPAL